MTDVELMHRWAAKRDADAFRQIVLRYGPMVYATCRRILRNSPTAEDVAQECFEQLCRTAAPPKTHLGGWLHSVATNRSLNKCKEESRRKEREEAFARAAETKQPIGWDDIYQFVDEAIVELPDELREPLVAHYLNSRTHRAIGKELGIPRRTVSHRIQRGLDTVGATLRNRGISISTVTLGTFFSSHMAEASALPVALQAGLGKLALANASQGTTSAATVAVPVAGASLVAPKTLSILLVGIGIAVLSWWFYPRGEEASPTREDVPQEARVESDDVTEPPSAPVPENSLEELATTLAEALEQQESVEAPADSSVSGVVQDEDGLPIAGAEIRNESPSPWTKPQGTVLAVSDSDGRFTLKRSSLDDPVLAAYREGYIPGQAVARGSNVVISLSPAGDVVGYVMQDGEPVSQVPVDLGTSYNTASRVSTITDDAGFFAFRNVPVGERALTAKYPDGRRRGVLVVEVEAGKEVRTDFMFEQGTASLEGNVLIDGEAPASYRVRGWLYSEGGQEFLTNATGTRTESSFRYTGLPAGLGKFRIIAIGVDGGERSRDAQIQLVAGEVSRFDVDFRSVASISGKVTGLFPNGNSGILVFPDDVEVPDPHEVEPEDFFALRQLYITDIGILSEQTETTIFEDDIPPGRYLLLGYSVGSDELSAEAFRKGHFAKQNIELRDGSALTVELNLE